MRQTLDNQLAIFLRKRRGEMTYSAFAKKLGITPSSLFRLENCQQSVTLKTLQQIMDRLKCSWPAFCRPQICFGYLGRFAARPLPALSCTFLNHLPPPSCPNPHFQGYNNQIGILK